MNSSSDKCRLCFIIRILSFYRSVFLKINVFKFVLFEIFRQPMAPQMETIFLKTGRELCHSLRCHYQRSGEEKIMAAKGEKYFTKNYRKYYHPLCGYLGAALERYADCLLHTGNKEKVKRIKDHINTTCTTCTCRQKLS